MLARASLRPQARDDLDDEVDLVGQERIEIDKAVAGELRQLDVRRQPRVLGEPPAVFVKELAEQRSRPQRSSRGRAGW